MKYKPKVFIFNSKGIKFISINIKHKNKENNYEIYKLCSLKELLLFLYFCIPLTINQKVMK